MPVPGAGRTKLGPVGSGNAAKTLSTRAENASPSPVAAPRPGWQCHRHPRLRAGPGRDASLHGRLSARTGSFEMFGDVAGVAACLPGVALTGTPTPERAEGVITVRLGPIAAHFQGAARIERDLAGLSGRITGIGRDQRSRSATQGEIRYRLVAVDRWRGNARRSFNRLQPHRRAGTDRAPGIGPRPRGPADRGVCAQSRAPPCGRCAGRPCGDHARSERRGLADRSVARAHA